MQKHRVILLGCGRMGKNHLRTILADTDFVLVSVVDPMAPGCMRLIPNSLSYDAAIIATPTHTHSEAAQHLLHRGKAVLLEKPMALDSAQCQRILAIPGRLVVGHVERFNPAVQALASVLESGRIGEPLRAVATRIGPAPPDVDVFADLAVHDIDIAGKLFGTLRAEGALVKEDLATLHFRSDRGATVRVCVGRHAFKCRTLRVLGSKGTASVDYIAQSCTVDGIPMHVERAEPLPAQLRAFGHYLSTGDMGHLASGQDAARAVELAGLAGV